MAATTPAAFDPKPRQLGSTIDCIAGGAILAGQAVVLAANGVSWTVHPSDADTSLIEKFVGIALYSQATTGGHVAVAGMGSIILACESEGAVIDAGDNLGAGAAAGCVKTLTDADSEMIGYAIEDISANSTGYIVVLPQVALKGA